MKSWFPRLSVKMRTNFVFPAANILFKLKWFSIVKLLLPTLRKTYLNERIRPQMQAKRAIRKRETATVVPRSNRWQVRKRRNPESGIWNPESGIRNPEIRNDRIYPDLFIYLFNDFIYLFIYLFIYYYFAQTYNRGQNLLKQFVFRTYESLTLKYLTWNNIYVKHCVAPLKM